jgi:hypothetical protein
VSYATREPLDELLFSPAVVHAEGAADFAETLERERGEDPRELRPLGDRGDERALRAQAARGRMEDRGRYRELGAGEELEDALCVVHGAAVT